jgi:hypothetical protein
MRAEWLKSSKSVTLSIESGTGYRELDYGENVHARVVSR